MSTTLSQPVQRDVTFDPGAMPSPIKFFEAKLDRAEKAGQDEQEVVDHTPEEAAA